MGCLQQCMPVSRPSSDFGSSGGSGVKQQASTPQHSSRNESKPEQSKSTRATGATEGMYSATQLFTSMRPYNT